MLALVPTISIHWAAALAAFVCLEITQAAAQSAPEDQGRFCPLVTRELARKIATALSEVARKCEVECHGCGCKGGPGYRENATEQCVGWLELIEKCGEPPHVLCAAECEPVVPGCIGRAWIKQLAKNPEMDVPFIAGRERVTNGARRAADRERQPQAQGLVPAEFVCGTKRKCAEMRSCDEAKFHLTNCGARWLDGDGDGRPCNKLCR